MFCPNETYSNEHILGTAISSHKLKITLHFKRNSYYVPRVIHVYKCSEMEGFCDCIIMKLLYSCMQTKRIVNHLNLSYSNGDNTTTWNNEPTVLRWTGKNHFFNTLARIRIKSLTIKLLACTNFERQIFLFIYFHLEHEDHIFRCLFYEQLWYYIAFSDEFLNVNV